MSCNNSILREIPRAKLPVSVQLMLRAAEHPGAHILDYLARCEHAAAIHNRRDLVDHYRECWRVVFDAVCGLLPLPMLVRIPIPACPPPQPMPLKGWEKQKYSKPVRKVIGREDREGKDCNGMVTYHYTVLKLECGHEHESDWLLDAQEQPRNRRCHECAKTEHAAKVELQRLKGVRQ